MDIEGGDDPEQHERAPSVVAAALEPDTQIVRRGGRGRLVLGSLVVTGLLATGVALVARSDGEADGGAALRAAQQFVDGAEGYRFEQLSERRVVTGDPDGAGSDTTTRSLLTGTVAGPRRWHVVADPGGDPAFEELPQMETKRIDDQLYTSGLMMEPGTGPSWVAVTIPDGAFAGADPVLYEDMGFEDDDPYADEMRLDIAIQAYLGDGTGAPAAITRVITAASEPVVEEERGDGGVLLRVQLPPSPELADHVSDLPTVDATLLLDRDRRPEEARFTAEAGTASADVVVRFHWDPDVTVEPPAEADIDRTPWISEEALADLEPALLLAPASIPVPMELVGATVMPAFMGDFDGDGEEDDCPQLSLMFGSKADLHLEPPEPGATPEELEERFSEMRFLDVSISGLACNDMYDIDDFDGEVGGFPALGGGGDSWEVAVGDAMVTVYTGGFDDAEIEAMIASLQPTTVDALAAAIPPWVAETMASGEAFGAFSMGGMMMGTMGSFG